MRVAHLTTVDLSLRYLLLAQLVAVREQGGHAVGISAPGPFVPELTQFGVKHIALHASTRRVSLTSDLRAALGLWRILRRERFDVLHTHNPKPGVYGRVIGRLAGVPIVVNTVHGLYLPPRSRRRTRFLVLLLEVLAARFAHGELVQNIEDLDRLRALPGYPSGRSHLLGNGVDLSRFDPQRFGPSERRRVRDELGLTDRHIAIVCVGRLVAEKGYPELIAAAEQLDERYVVFAVGPPDPAKRDSLDDTTIEEATRRGVRFLGMRSDVDRLYAAADIFVLPSHREGFPRAAMEAAAMGLPVIATDIRGCRQVVSPGETGLLVPVADRRRLVDAIRCLGDDPARRRAMGIAARRKAEAEFDERVVVARVLALYRDCLQKKWSRSSKRGCLRLDGRSAAKRLLDVVGAAAGLTLAAPIMIVVALAIRVTMGSPVLFVQERVGRHGKLFTLYKFRTMRDARNDRGQLLEDEARLTRVGRFLRRSSLDELPTLLNVLRGEMSLVGPRPLLEEYLELYTPEQARRHEVRPGITGWVQVNGRNDIPWDDKFSLDIWYVDNWSLRLDITILIRTVGQVLTGRGVSKSGYATTDFFRGCGDSGRAGTSG